MTVAELVAELSRLVALYPSVAGHRVFIGPDVAAVDEVALHDSAAGIELVAGDLYWEEDHL